MRAMSDRLYRFIVKYGDLRLHFGAALHPSESIYYFIARALAYVLHYQSGLSFSRGVCIGEEPALYVPAVTGRMDLWIDVGCPSRKRLDKALRKASLVIVYGYGNSLPYKKMLSLKGTERLRVFWLETTFLDALSATIKGGRVHWEFSFENERITVNEFAGVRSRVLSTMVSSDPRSA